MKNIFIHSYERLTYDIIKQSSEKYGAVVFPKVRVADCIDIDKCRISKDEYSYALKSHFDFVVCSELGEILFAVEFDGPQHWRDAKVIARDKMKYNICKNGGFSLLRINEFFVDEIGQVPIISLLIESRFLYDGFVKEQEEGNIPWDEPFDPLFLRYSESKKPVFDLFDSIRRRIERRYGWPPCRNTRFVQHLSHGEDRYGYYHCLFIVEGEINTYGLGSCKSYNFEPLEPWEIAGFSAEYNMMLNLEKILDGRKQSLTISKVQEIKHKFQNDNFLFLISKRNID